MAELKPCPFCGCALEKNHVRYTSIHEEVIEYDEWWHPFNRCVLDASSPEGFIVFGRCVEAWNRRANNGK